MKKQPPLLKWFDFSDPEGRARLLRLFWLISTFMLVLGWILIIYFIIF